MNKATLRERLVAQRSTVTPEQRLVASHDVCQQLAAFEWSNTRSVLCYRARDGWNELDLTEFVAYLAHAFPQIRIDTVGQSRHEPLPTTHYDAILVPTLGYTADSHRLGMGAGWYDTLLAAQPDARIIGICYTWGLIEFTPDSHDQKLSTVVVGRVQ